MSLKRIFTKAQFAYRNKFLSRPCCTFFIIIICIWSLVMEFVIRQNEIFLYHFIFAFRPKIFILWIIGIIRTMKLTFFNRVWTFMFSYIINGIYHNCKFRKHIYHDELHFLGIDSIKFEQNSFSKIDDRVKWFDIFILILLSTV